MLYFEKILNQVILMETTAVVQLSCFYEGGILNKGKGSDFFKCAVQLLKRCQCSQTRTRKTRSRDMDYQ